MKFSEYQIELPDMFKLNFRTWDEQHSTILGIFRYMIRHDFDHNYGDIVMELEQYAMRHFELEHQLMEQIGFPGEEGHDKEHQIFNEKLKEFKDSILAEDNPRMDILKFLNDWFQNHIDINDRKIAQMIRESNPKCDSPLLT